MSIKLIEKYIPKKYRDLIIDGMYGGLENFQQTYSNGGAHIPKLNMHITPIKGKHQGYSSPPDVFQVVLPNKHRIVTSRSRGSALKDMAFAHISNTTGVVTILTDKQCGQFMNKTLSEMFNDTVCVNSSKYKFSPYRIGDYALKSGLQFKYGPNGIVPLKVPVDVRIKTDRKVSLAVHKELQVVKDIVEGKGAMLRSMYNTGAHSYWKRNEDLVARVMEITGSHSLADKFGFTHNALSKVANKYDMLQVSENAAIGVPLVFDRNSLAWEFHSAVKGDMTSELMALILTGYESAAMDVTKLAPIFIAARGGYSLTTIEHKGG